MKQKLAKELHKSKMKTFEKRKVYSCFIDNICDADLRNVQLISKYNKRIRIIDIHSKYAWLVPLKDKKAIAITNTFQDESNHKPNKLWVDKDIEFCNRSMEPLLQGNGIEMYSTHNEGKSVAAETY